MNKRKLLANAAVDTVLRVAYKSRKDPDVSHVSALHTKATQTIRRPAPLVAMLHTGDDHYRILLTMGRLAARAERAEQALAAIRENLK